MSLTDMVIMPGADYQDICDAVRKREHTTDILKSGDIAPAILGKGKPVYKTIDGIPYRRTFHDDFDSGDINHNYWTEDYHPSRADPAYYAYSDVRQENGSLICRCKPTQPARLGTSTDQAVSGVMSGKWNGMHLSDTIYHDFRPWYGLMSQEGYYELRAKISAVDVGHCAWWGIGTENTANERAEIDLFEIFGYWAKGGTISRSLHQNGDSTVTQKTERYESGIDLSADCHTFGCLWENGVMKWYLDGVLYSTWDIDTPQYPMIWYINLYRTRNEAKDALGTSEFVVDYFSIYKKADSEAEVQPTIVSYSPVEVTTYNGYTVDNQTGKLAEMPLYCYVNWSDGSRTEHWVKWEIFDDAKKSTLDAFGTVAWPGVVYDLGLQIMCNVTNVTENLYKITKNLTNVTLSNDADTIISGSEYSAEVIVPDGYTLSNIAVSMGGANYTDTVVSGTTIFIPSVKNNVVITASAKSNSSTYQVTNNLTNCTNSNPASAVNVGEGYNAKISAYPGSTLSTVKVIMGGVDVTSQVYSNGVVSISEVTGDIIITAMATVNVEPTQYTITNNLNKVTTTNTNTTVEANAMYTATLVPDTDYALSTVTVTMGGVDITSSVYADGVITIPEVTGAVVITAKAISAVYAFNPLDGVTWTQGQAYNSNTGELVSASGQYCTEKFKAKDCYYNVTLTDSNATFMSIHAWDENGVYLGLMSNGFVANSKHSYAIRVSNTKDLASEPVTMIAKNNSNGAEYHRFVLADYEWGYDNSYGMVATTIGTTSKNNSTFLDSASATIGFQGTTVKTTGIDTVFRCNISSGTVYLYASFKDAQTAVAYFTEHNSVLEINLRQKP